MKIDGQIEKSNIKNCFIMLKDPKRNFNSNPACTLINPSKMQMGKISKVILQDICATLRIALNVNQWCHIIVFSGFRITINSFVKYGIKDFYPSIMEKTGDAALNLYFSIRL